MILCKVLPLAMLCLLLCLSSQLDTILTQADQWTFDTFALDRASNGRPVSVLGFWLIHQSGLLERLRLDANKLTR